MMVYDTMHLATAQKWHTDSTQTIQVCEYSVKQVSHFNSLQYQQQFFYVMDATAIPANSQIGVSLYNMQWCFSLWVLLYPSFGNRHKDSLANDKL